MSYINAALHAGYEERMIVSFAWCISEFERHLENYTSFMILWHYKWVLHEIWRFPHFPAKLIYRLIDDTKRKCQNYGYSLGPYYKFLHIYALSRGDVDEAKEYLKLWKGSRRDSLSDCEACDLNAKGYYYFTLGYHGRGFQTIREILAGKKACAEIPHGTYGMMLLPLLEKGEASRATGYAKKGIRLLRGKRFILEYGQYLEYYTTVQPRKARQLLEQTISYAMETKVDWNRFIYLTSVRIYLDNWYSKKRKARLALPEIQTTEWVTRETDRLAAEFYRRNGNHYCQQYINARMEKVKKLIDKSSKN